MGTRQPATAVLWVVALTAHLGYDYLVGQGKSMAQLGTATLFLYLVASLGVQRLVDGYRAQRLRPSGLGVPVAGQRRGDTGREPVGGRGGTSPRSLCSELSQAARRIGEASMPTTVRRGH